MLRQLDLLPGPSVSDVQEPLYYVVHEGVVLGAGTPSGPVNQVSGEHAGGTGGEKRGASPLALGDRGLRRERRTIVSFLVEARSSRQRHRAGTFTIMREPAACGGARLRARSRGVEAEPMCNAKRDWGGVVSKGLMAPQW